MFNGAPNAFTWILVALPAYLILSKRFVGYLKLTRENPDVMQQGGASGEW